MFWRKIKIRTKLLLVLGVFLILFLQVGLFSFFALRQATDSFSLIQNISLPQIIVTSQLRAKMDSALLSAYDYVATGDTVSKESYEQTFSEVFIYEIRLFEVAQTDAEYQVSQDVNQAIFEVKQASDNLILAYEENPESSLRDQFVRLNEELDKFETFILNDVEAPILDTADENSDAIAQQVAIVNQNLLWSGIVTLIIFLISVFFIQRSISRPLGILLDAAKDFGKGEFYEVSLKNKDELGLFADTFTVMGQDIEAATAALEVELEKTKKLDQQKSEFLQVAAHQLRTPTSGIKWLLKMLVDGDLGELNKDQVEQIGKGLDNADRMVRVVNDLLEVTRVQAPRYAYEFTKVQPADVIQEVATSLEQNAAANEIKLNVTLPEKPLPAADLDLEKFKLMVTNLLDNAIKYNRKGGNTWIRLVGIDENQWQIIVKDEGVGIPEDQQDQVFKKFFRGRNVVQVDTMGSGLGLSMVKDIVDNHEGTITFESAENQGTTFWVTLPYIQSEPEGAETPTFKTIAKKLKDEAPESPALSDQSNQSKQSKKKAPKKSKKSKKK